MIAMASQITSLMIAYSTVYSGTDQRKHQSSASLAFVGGIHGGPVNSPHAVARKIFPFDDVIMENKTDYVSEDGLSPCVTMNSMCMIFAVYGKKLLVFHEQEIMEMQMGRGVLDVFFINSNVK